jgi:integrase
MYFDVSKTAIYELNTIIGNNSHLLCVKNKFCLGKASMEIERDRPLKDLSEDLGHSSSATTDTVYVQVERKRRASSGKDRKVE